MENDNENDQQIKENKWYSVKLVNGEIYYGQIFNTKSNPLIIKNIYYDYDQISNNNEELINPDNLRLVKRGNEKNGNDGTMEIIRTKVLFIEPLRDDSKILQAILSMEQRLIVYIQLTNLFGVNLTLLLLNYFNMMGKIMCSILKIHL